MTHPTTHTTLGGFSVGRMWAMAKKEAIQLRRDARSLGLAFLLPAILLLLFGYAIQTDVDDIDMAVLDRDHTVESRSFTEAFARSGYFVVRRTLTRATEVEPLIDRGTVRVALVIPERFAADLAARRLAPVELVLDGSDAKTATVALGYAEAIAKSFSSRAALASTVTPVVHAETRVWYNQSLDGSAMIVPGLIAVIMSIIAAMLTSLTVAREWERGTMEQLAATPVSRAEVIFGKLLPYLAIGTVDVAVALAAALYVFHVPFRGSLAVFALSSLVFLLGVLALGIFLSTKLKSQLLATQASLFATWMPALILSGFMYSIDNMPTVLQFVSRIVPARYLVSIMRAVFLRGVGLDVLWAPLVGLSLYALAVLALSVRTFKKELA
jgi:ABC-2 type transport system permease protein